MGTAQRSEPVLKIGDNMLTFSFIIKFTRRWTHLEGFLISLGFFHLRIALETQATQIKALEAPIEIPKEMIQVAKAIEEKTKAAEGIGAESIRSRIMQKNFILDATKRKSLQPSNLASIPGWNEHFEPPKEHHVPHPKITGPLEKTFIHDFFGSQLMVGDMRIGGGLSKGRHRVEITQDQLRIDNIPQVVNQGELERIKDIIRASRA
mgnify:CR=1 FL=1